MIFDIRQTSTDLFSADFEIRDSRSRLGRIRLQGRATTNNADIDGFYGNHSFSLRFGLKDRSIEGRKLQPYTVSIDGRDCGAVFETSHKHSLLSSSSFHRLVLNGIEYDRFPIAFGEEGGKHPVYCGTRQVAQINKDAEVCDALHVYHVLCEDEWTGLCAVLLACFMHVQGAYQPGVKVKQAVVKRISVTKDAWLLEKYHPEFESRIHQMDT